MNKTSEQQAMRPQTKSLLVSLAIVVVSFVFLAPKIVSPIQSVMLLNETIVLSQDNYQAQYTLSLNASDQLNIQLSGNGDLVSLTITQSGSPNNPLVDQEDQTIFSSSWTVPQTGSYVFTVSTPDDGATANLIVMKT